MTQDDEPLEDEPLEDEPADDELLDELDAPVVPAAAAGAAPSLEDVDEAAALDALEAPLDELPEALLEEAPLSGLEVPEVP